MIRKHTVAAGFTAVVLAATATVAAAPGAQAAPSTTDRAGKTSLAAVLAADGHHFDKKWGDFDILDAAVMAVLKEKPKSPVAVLAKGKVRLTAFLPTDRAFQRPRQDADRQGAEDRAGDVQHARQGRRDRRHRDRAALPRRAGQDPGRAKVVKADGKKLTTAQGGHRHRQGEGQEGHPRRRRSRPRATHG